MTKPKLSVLIDTYNHERYIEQAVVSVIEQDFPPSDYEIVVVDDGSTDRTAEIVRKFAPRVRLISKQNGGQATAFNAGVRELRGEIVSFLDGDDWFAPGKLVRVMEALESNPHATAVGHGYYEFNEEGGGQTSVRLPKNTKLLNLDTPEAARDAYLAWAFLLMGALTVRKKVLDQSVPVPEALKFCADVPIVTAALAGGVSLIAEPLFYYRHHSDNLFVVREENEDKLRRRAEMTELAFELTEPLTMRMGVRRESVAAFLYPKWVESSRFLLAAFGGSRVKTFETEMRGFQMDNQHPGLMYRLFKYLIVGAATLALPSRQFYRAREWYGHKDLGRFREQFARSR
jgi:glycosyltransferase involved in cell wall biosynthesis